MTRHLGVAVMMLASTGCTLYLAEDDQPPPDSGVVRDAGWWQDDAPIGDGSCDMDLACPAPQAGKTSVCGRLVDVETGQHLSAATPTTMECDAGGAADGPCALALRFYDALQYASNPSVAPLAPGSLYQDDCGRFAAVDVPHPADGFLAVVVDDAPRADDLHRETAVAMPVTAGEVVQGVRVESLLASTDASWSAALGIGSVTDAGATLATYTRAGVPVAGVTLSGGSAALEFAGFTDTDPATRSALDPAQHATGADGAVLLRDLTGILQISATGGIEPACHWPATQGADIPGVLLTVRVEAICP